MLEQLDELYEKSLTELKRVGETAVLETWYKETLGRKGSIYLMTRQVGQLTPEERPVFGKRINAVKQELEAAYEQRLAELRAVELQSQMASSAIDVADCIRPPKPCAKSTVFGAIWGFRSTAAVMWKLTNTTLNCSTSRKTTRRAICGTLSIRRHPVSFCAPTPALARFTPCMNIIQNRSASSCPVCVTGMNR